ncbi:MAG: FAD-dependent oxidoreductase [Elusimicrobiales bacterium]
MRTDTLIIGAGLTGLSCAWHLERLGAPRYILAEKNDYPGGLCASFSQNGFSFDCSGHLLHLHSGYGKSFIFRMLRGNLEKLRRRAEIYSSGVYTPYPFQAALCGLPDRVVSDCVSGFLKAWRENKTPPFDSPFDRWAMSVFGEGICRHFMFPYNRKLWRVPLPQLRADWCAPFVPRPGPEEVIAGAYGPQRASFGYNTEFYYPSQGGAGALCAAIADGLGNGFMPGCGVLRVNLSKKTALINNLGEVEFSRLVNTMPLKDFCGIIEDAPAAVRESAKLLRHNRVDVFNFGFRAPARRKLHWAYFPEDKFAFYRAGIASHFSRHVSPAGYSSFYTETASPPSSKPDTAALERQMLSGLRRCGLISAPPAARMHIAIPCAYAVYDANRSHALSRILPWLEKKGCLSTGRYGGWKYSFMEEAVLDGKAAANVSAGNGACR